MPWSQDSAKNEGGGGGGGCLKEIPVSPPCLKQSFDPWLSALLWGLSLPPQLSPGLLGSDASVTVDQLKLVLFCLRSAAKV